MPDTAGTCPSCGASSKGDQQAEPSPRVSRPIPAGGGLAAGGGILYFSGLAGPYGMTFGISAMVIGGAMVVGGLLSD